MSNVIVVAVILILVIMESSSIPKSAKVSLLPAISTMENAVTSTTMERATGSGAPAPGIRIVSDGFVSCAPPRATYFIKYANGYTQLTRLHVTQSYNTIAFDDYGTLLPYTLIVNYTLETANPGVDTPGAPAGCSVASTGS